MIDLCINLHVLICPGTDQEIICELAEHFRELSSVNSSDYNSNGNVRPGLGGLVTVTPVSSDRRPVVRY